MHPIITKGFVVAILALAQAGCIAVGRQEIVLSSADRPVEIASRPQAETELPGRQRDYERDPGGKRGSLRYAAALTALARDDEATAVLAQAVIRNPEDADLAAAYGKSLFRSGRIDEAKNVLARAHTADRPDWRVLNTLAAIEDSQKRHRDAQAYYGTALKIVPSNATVLANLALSQALDNQTAAAEQTIKDAIAANPADDRLRETMALIQIRQGKKDKARDAIAGRPLDMGAIEARATVLFGARS